MHTFLFVPGILPTFELLALWITEQVQVFVFGGSPTAGGRIRSLSSLALSVVSLGCAFAIEVFQPLATTPYLAAGLVTKSIVF